MPISVLIAGLPRLLTEMLSDAVDLPPDYEVVGTTAEDVRAGSVELDRTIRALAPDAAIVGMRSTEVLAVESTARKHLDLAVVAVRPDGTQAWNVETHIDFIRLEAISPSGIRRTLAEIVHVDPRRNETRRTVGDAPAPNSKGTSCPQH